MISFYEVLEWPKLSYCGKKTEQREEGLTAKLSGVVKISVS